jgi:hypothetical protein
MIPTHHIVMPGLVPGIRDFFVDTEKDVPPGHQLHGLSNGEPGGVDGRDEPGHDRENGTAHA